MGRQSKDVKAVGGERSHRDKGEGVNRHKKPETGEDEAPVMCEVGVGGVSRHRPSIPS